MRYVRIIAATLMLAVSGFMGGFAAIIAHARPTLAQLEPDQLFSKALALTIGAPFLAYLSVLMARGAGEPRAMRTAIGVFACLGAFALAIQGTVVLNQYPVQGAPFLVAAAVLCLASAMLFAGTARKTSVTSS